MTEYPYPIFTNPENDPNINTGYEKKVNLIKRLYQSIAKLNKPKTEHDDNETEKEALTLVLDGKFHRYYDKNKKLKAEVEFHENWNKKFEIHYDNNGELKIGIEWDKDGKPRFAKCYYEDGIIRSEIQEYGENGNRKFIKQYDENEKLIGEIVCDENGKPRFSRIFDDNGNIKLSLPLG